MGADKTKNTPPWEHAWILVAISMDGSRRSTDLPSLLAAADYINHGIPSYRQLAGALYWLSSRGLIERAGARPLRVRQTPKGGDLVTSSAGSEPNPLRRSRQAHEALSTRTTKQRAPSKPPLRITRTTYERAVASYRSR